MRWLMPHRWDALRAVLYPLHTAFGHQAWGGGVRLHAAGWGSMVTSLSQAGRALLPDYSEPIPVALKRGRGQLRGCRGEAIYASRSLPEGPRM